MVMLSRAMHWYICATEFPPNETLLSSIVLLGDFPSSAGHYVNQVY